MALASNFTLIVGDSPVTIGDSQLTWEKKFETPGRARNQNVIIMFNLRGLVVATTSVEVKINDKVVGKLVPYACPDGQDKLFAKNWYTQTIALGGADLNDGTNEIQINAVTYPDTTPNDVFDDFAVKDVSCFYHVNV